MVTSPQLRANFAVAELVHVASCKCQIARAYGLPASAAESGGPCGLLTSISCWLMAQHSISFHLLSRSSYPQMGEWLLKSPMMTQFSVVGSMSWRAVGLSGERGGRGGGGGEEGGVDVENLQVVVW